MPLADRLAEYIRACFTGIWVQSHEHEDTFVGRHLLPRFDRPDDTNWTGAEIRSCCRLAALLEVPLSEAADNIVPVATTASESVQRLRDWASGRCLSAQQSGIYQHTSPNGRARCQVDPGPSRN